MRENTTEPTHATRWGVRAVDTGNVRIYINGLLFDFTPRGADDLAQTIRVILGDAEASIRALLARWQRDVSNLYAANEEEGHAPAAMLRATRAAEIERCIGELREALRGPQAPGGASTAPTPGTEAHGETTEAQEGRQ